MKKKWLILLLCYPLLISCSLTHTQKTTKITSPQKHNKIEVIKSKKSTLPKTEPIKTTKQPNAELKTKLSKEKEAAFQKIFLNSLNNKEELINSQNIPKINENQKNIELEVNKKEPTVNDKTNFIAKQAISPKKINVDTKIINEINNASKNNTYLINFKYPNITGLNNLEIQNNLNNNIKTRIENWIKNYKKDNQIINSEFQTEVTNNFLSIKFTISIEPSNWSPINKPIYKVVTLNYDLNNSKEIYLEKLLGSAPNYLQIISNIALADLKEQLKNSSDLSNIPEATIKEITAPKLENYQTFVFNKKGITIIFNNDKILNHKTNYPKVLILYGKIEQDLGVVINKK